VPIEYHPSSRQFRGQGIVYLSFNDDDGRYGGYWDLGGDQPTPLEECPQAVSAAEAVRWGRERAPVVMIRPEEDQGRYYWAGAEPPTGKYAELPLWRASGDIQ
jgi:hypothetical protein